MPQYSARLLGVGLLGVGRTLLSDAFEVGFGLDRQRLQQESEQIPGQKPRTEPALSEVEEGVRPHNHWISKDLRARPWGGRRGLNPQRPEPQSGALPIELLPPFLLDYSNWGESCQRRGGEGCADDD